MALISSLSRLLVEHREENWPMASVGGSLISWQQFLLDIRRVTGCLRAMQEQSASLKAYAIYCDSAYWFAVGLFAALHLRKDLVLLPNIQKGMLNLVSADTLLLTDRKDLVNLENGFDLCGSQLNSAQATTFEVLDPASCISVFTSGTRNTPERIRKTLRNFDVEVNCLEQMFGDRCANSQILGSVTHQHIYGCLFRVLWPLCAGRTLVDELIEFPEQLARYPRDNSILVSSPALLKRIADEPDLALPALVFSSGGPLDLECNRKLVDKTACALFEVFGSTETGGVAVRQLAVSELWRLMPGVKATTASEGQIEIESEHCSGGHFVMGDRCRFVDSRHFTLLGRVDRIVKIEEKRVSLTAVESLLVVEDWISSVHALVLPGKRELLALVVELNAKGMQRLEVCGSQQLKQQVREILSQLLERVTLPRKIRFVSLMPLTAQGKLDKDFIRGMFQS